MPPRSGLEFRLRSDAPTDCPGDLAFDRPDVEELFEVAWDVVEDLRRAGFSGTEMAAVVEAMETIVETRRNGEN